MINHGNFVPTCANLENKVGTAYYMKRLALCRRADLILLNIKYNIICNRLYDEGRHVGQVGTASKHR